LSCRAIVLPNFPRVPVDFMVTTRNLIRSIPKNDPFANL